MKTYQERVLEAVDDENWQKFRVSLKGHPTATKLSELEVYYDQIEHFEEHHLNMSENFERVRPVDLEECHVCIRLDNYIKSLCRGGLLYSSESLYSCVAANWDIKIKK